MPRTTGRAVDAGALVLPLALIALGVVCWALARSGTSSSGHVYAGGGTPPAGVQLTGGHTYFLATPGGVPALDRQGRDVTKLSCTATSPDGVRARLVLQAEASDTKAVNEFATFLAPATDRYAVACAGVRAVFVDDADDASTDRSGLLLVIAVPSLVIGLALLLSALRVQQARRASPAPGQ